MILAILIEAITFIGSITISYIYEGKALLKLGKENYKIRLGKLDSYNKDLEQNLFLPFLKENRNLKFYLENILCFIPGINIFYSHIKGKKRYENIVDYLVSKRIAIPMTEEEIREYMNSENSLEKIYYLIFNSMNSYRSHSSDIENSEVDMNHVEIIEFSEEVKREVYERDISYMEVMLSIQNSYDKPKQKRLKYPSK